MLSEEERNGRAGLLSLELPDGVIVYTKLYDYVTVPDVLDYLARSENPYTDLEKMGNETMRIDEYAGYEQSEDCRFTVEASMGSNDVVVYEINGGEGGIKETERTDDNVRFTDYDLKDYQRRENQADKDVGEGVVQDSGKKNAKDLLSEKLIEGVKSVMNERNYRNWLNTNSHFFANNYSLNNALLIYAQKPDATYTMGYEAWKDYGRNVAKGAKGAKIFVPVIAYEKKEGALYSMIMSKLREQLKQNPEQTAVYRIGVSKSELTMNSSGNIGLRVGGKENGIFSSQRDVKKFISNAILGKVPMYYNVGTVFDVKDTTVPEHLWMKKGYTKDEVVMDEQGKPITNRNGEVKIINTPERQARFMPNMDLSIKENDPKKMMVLYEAIKAVSEKNGVPVSEAQRDSDDILKDGADGYFSRRFTEKNPKGFIVLADDLGITKKCAVLMHEIGHSDLHGNLLKLEQEMGEKNISRHMREIQAESVAYATAHAFGVITDTSSFAYIAEWTQGLDMQDMKKSLDVIYNETKKLTEEIEKELNERGLNLDLTEKITMEKEAVESLARGYAAYMLEQAESVKSKMEELPEIAADNRKNQDLLDILKEQKLCLDRQADLLMSIKDGIDDLQKASGGEAQAEAKEGLEAAKRAIENEKSRFENLTVSFEEISSRTKTTLKEEFRWNPKGALETMKEQYPKLKELSSLQLSYAAKSPYIKDEYGSLLKTNPGKFVEAVCRRAETLDGVVAKNGAFVEINRCEQWTEKPIVKDGALLHPNVANSIIKQAETQIRSLKREAEKNGEYFPYNKCDLTVFFRDNSKQEFGAYQTRVDIGDKTQTSLTDHLTQACGKDSDIVAEITKAVRERGAKDKTAFYEFPEQAQDEAKDVSVDSVEAMTNEEWDKAITDERNAAEKGNAAEKAKENAGKDKYKDENNRG